MSYERKKERKNRKERERRKGRKEAKEGKKEGDKLLFSGNEILSLLSLKQKLTLL